MFKKSILIVIASSAIATYSQTDTLETDTVKVLVARTPVQSASSARLFTKINSKDVTQNAVQSIEDYFDYIPYLDLRQRGLPGVQSDLSIRGSNYEQTLILLDGVPMTDVQSGHHNLNIPVPMELYSGVEIIASGSSQLFGPKAMAGSVNFITRAPETNNIFVSASGGEYGFRRFSGGFQLNKKGWGLGLSGQHMASDGYATNTDFKQNNAYLQLMKQGRKGKIQLNAGIGNKDFGAQNFYTATYPLQHEIVKYFFSSLVFDYKLNKWALRGNAYARQHRDRFELYRQGEGWYERSGKYYIMGKDTAPGWYTGHNYHQTLNLGGMVNLSRQFGKHYLSLGAETRHEQILSNVLGENTTPKEVPFGSDNAMFTKSGERDNFSIYAEDRFELNHWIFNVGALYNLNSKFGNNFYPGVEISRLLKRGWQLFAAANIANRFPTYTDLYYNRGGAVGSKDLKAEEAINYELGTQWKNKHLIFKSALFARDGKNLIDWVRLNGSSTTTATNLTRIFYYGIDASLLWKPHGDLAQYLNYISAGVFYMNADNQSNGFESNYALDFISFKTTGNLNLKLSDKQSLNLACYVQQRRGGYFKPGATAETAFKTMVNCDVKWMFNANPFTVYMEAANLFNYQIYDLGNVILPGRWLRAGISFKMSK